MLEPFRDKDMPRIYVKDEYLKIIGAKELNYYVWQINGIVTAIDNSREPWAIMSRMKGK